jgi:hypothetical protein
MDDMNISDGNALTNKVKINLNMLGALMLDGVGGEIDNLMLLQQTRVVHDRGLCSPTCSW